jgi:hypothetical protein
MLALEAVFNRNDALPHFVRSAITRLEPDLLASVTEAFGRDLQAVTLDTRTGYFVTQDNAK